MACIKMEDKIKQPIFKGTIRMLLKNGYKE